MKITPLLILISFAGQSLAGTRNILLIGKTGNGKSTLGNVLVNKNGNFTEVFEESPNSAGKTRNIKIENFNEIDPNGKKITYRVIDTPGFGDIKFSTKQVLEKLAELSSILDNGLNQILFVTKDRFTKEEIEVYKIAEKILFDHNAPKYTTIVRTGFAAFYDPDATSLDIGIFNNETEQMSKILENCNGFIHVDNPSINITGNSERAKKQIEFNKGAREDSRKVLLDHLLSKCQGNYLPSNLEGLTERAKNYKTEEEQWKAREKELEKRVYENRINIDVNGIGCFPNEALLTLENGETKLMKDAKLGDSVKCENDKHSKIFAIGHKEYENFNSYLKIKTAYHEDNYFPPLLISSNHYLYVDNSLKLAGDVKLGDHLVNERNELTPINSIERVYLQGINIPLTIDGSVVVNGIKTSCYTKALHPSIAEKLVLPLKKVYKISGGRLMGVEDFIVNSIINFSDYYDKLTSSNFKEEQELKLESKIELPHKA